MWMSLNIEKEVQSMATYMKTCMTIEEASLEGRSKIGNIAAELASKATVILRLLVTFRSITLPGGDATKKNCKSETSSHAAQWPHL